MAHIYCRADGFRKMRVSMEFGPLSLWNRIRNDLPHVINFYFISPFCLSCRGARQWSVAMFQCFFFLNPFAKKCRSVIKSLFNGTGHEHLLLVVFYFSCVFYNETAATVFVPNRCMRLGFLYIFFLLFSVLANMRVS